MSYRLGTQGLKGHAWLPPLPVLPRRFPYARVVCWCSYIYRKHGCLLYYTETAAAADTTTATPEAPAEGEHGVGEPAVAGHAQAPFFVFGANAVNTYVVGSRRCFLRLLRSVCWAYRPFLYRFVGLSA